MNTEMIIGIGASVFSAVASLPQLVKLFKEKKAGDISLLMYFVLLAGLGLWIYYGVLKEDGILIVSNFFALVLNLAVLVLALVYKKQSF